MEEIAPGLWRWTAPHPEWAPGAEPDSPTTGTSMSARFSTRTGTQPYSSIRSCQNQDQFWRWADERVRGRSAVVLTTLVPHRRSREQVAQRYAASTSRAKRNLPSGVESIVLRGAGETMFWLPKHRTLVPGDRILGAPDGGLRLCPESWLYWVRVDRDELRTLLKPLLELPIERVLVFTWGARAQQGRRSAAQVPVELDSRDCRHAKAAARSSCHVLRRDELRAFRAVGQAPHEDCECK